MPPARKFFQQAVTTCAREFPGGTVELGETRGRIIETEAYCSESDPACHTFFRTKARAFVEDHPAGTVSDDKVLIGPRIGISRAQEFPWRFGLDCPGLSRPFPRGI